MRHAILDSVDAGEQLDCCEYDYQPFGCHRYRREYQCQTCLRIEHCESDEYAINGSGRSECRSHEKLLVCIDGRVGDKYSGLHPFYTCVQCGCSESCHEVENEIFLRAEAAFKYGTEHQEGIHIEEYVPESAVHEHVCQYLPRLEEWRCRVEHGEIGDHEVFIYQRGDEHQYVDCHEILCHGRYL